MKPPVIPTVGFVSSSVSRKLTRVPPSLELSPAGARNTTPLSRGYSSQSSGISPALSGRARYIRGLALLQQKLPAQALPLLQEADGALAGTAYEKPVCQALERCCLALEDYKGAYEYAARQLRR